MTLTLLLDLDDTLLDTKLESFVPAYFQALAKHLAVHVPPDVMLPALLAGLKRMNENDDPRLTLQEVFEAEFYERLGVPRGALVAPLEQFYEQVFPALRDRTSERAEAKPFVDWATSKGTRLAIATDPLFPRQATYERLCWAGFEPEQFELVSTFEDFHFSKSQPAYYAEMLGRMGWPEGPVVMAGDDEERDISSAARLGLSTFHIVGDGDGGGATPGRRKGDLRSLRRAIESGELPDSVASIQTVEAILAVLRSGPAALSGLVRSMSAPQWTQKPAPEDWALTEIVCHLRDTEREINHAQIKLFEVQTEPFIPRPDSSVWARERAYLMEDGPRALLDLAEARVESLAMLSRVRQEDWQRGAKHAIFGPTSFQEVVGFMAEHDQLHVQQAWKVLHRRQNG